MVMLNDIKVLKITLIVIGSIFVLMLIAFGVYLLLNIQGVIESFEVNSPELEQKVLIASQGSDFKNTLVENLTQYLREKPVYIKVIDVTDLPDVNEDEWDGVVLIHTTERWKLQPDVKAYLKRAKDLSKVVLLTTSGSGKWETKDYDIDVITSASKKNELSSLTAKILARLDLILGNGDG